MYKAIRIVNTKKAWEEELPWAALNIYDANSDTLITGGHDVIVFEASTHFMMEGRINEEGMIFHAASFEVTGKGSNTAKIIVTKTGEQLG